jgi:NhaA family Na+:H+ antiporter
VGEFHLERSLEWVINDGLMVIFFFVVGMEIRREIAHGELSSWRRAAVPAGAALGGMLAPAAIYLCVAGGAETRSGWGVPMATDIAFAVGILTLLGDRVPASLRVQLLALAVIDDLGAILVIALFYSSGMVPSGLLVALAGLAGIFVMQRLGVRSKLAYVLPGVVTWAGVYASGVHPTIAGVLIGFATPVRAWFGPERFVSDVRSKLEQLAAETPSEVSSHALAEVLRQVEFARREALSPADSLVHTLHPWVAFGIMPVFALANAGVSLAGAPLAGPTWSVAAGVALGLLVGKPLGVLVAIGLMIKLRIGTLPAGLTLRHLLVLGLVAGVGFTMALFVAQLAFAEQSLLDAAKLGVLSASGLAGVVALVTGRTLPAAPDASPDAPS